MKKLCAVGLFLLVFVAGLLVGRAGNVTPEQLKVYTTNGTTVSVEFPDGNIYDYN